MSKAKGGQAPLADDEIVAICEETRWLGDLYQAFFVNDPKGPVKQNALVQTPDFVGNFLLDRAFDPSLEEFGLPGFRAIDPTCGTGHILLQMLGRLFQRWQKADPGGSPELHTRRALGSVHGVDCDPFAVSLAKLRLLRAALRLSGRVGVPVKPFPIKVAWGDSLLEPEHALQPNAVLDELRWMRKLCAAKGIDWKAESRAANRPTPADL